MSYYTEFSQYKGGDTMIKENTIRNNESNIKEFELLKHFYLRKKNLISLEEFEECLKEHKDTRLDRLLNAGVLKSINTKLEITSVGITIVEFFSRSCDQCGDIVYFNAFTPKAVCPKCGLKMTAKEEWVINKEGKVVKTTEYKDLMS